LGNGGGTRRKREPRKKGKGGRACLREQKKKKSTGRGPGKRDNPVGHLKKDKRRQAAYSHLFEKKVTGKPVSVSLTTWGGGK